MKMLSAKKLMSAFSLVLVCNVGSQSAQTPNQAGAAPAATSSAAKTPQTPGAADPQTASSLTTPAANPAAAAPATAASPKPAVAPLSPALLHAQELYRTGKFDPAIAEYNAIINANGPDAANAYAGLARVYLKQKKPADAFPAAQKAVALDANLS